ncbi:MAG: Uma2 family endonuclease [Lachnospiraceae bacterium]|nr:Uma2 family endonuclease [Lachnospiraceae bacterium]
MDKIITDDMLKTLMEAAADSDTSLLREPEAVYGWEKAEGNYTIDDYYALPDNVRAELIDGIFYYLSAPTITHQIISGRLYNTLDRYIEDKNGDCVPLIAPCDVQPDREDDRWMIQPDVMVVCDRNKLEDDRCVRGAPDFVAEVLSPSTKKRDRTVKRRKYRETGVREYWMIDPETEMIEVYIFKSTETDVLPRVYPFHETVPVSIFCGDCKVDFAKITRRR